MTTETLIQVNDLSVSYGPVQALDGVSIHVDRGELVAIVGANGAGKTTLLRTISGLQRGRAGTVTVAGQDVTSAEPDEIVRRGVVQVPEGRELFGQMTVKENLMVGALAAPGTRHPKIGDDLWEMFPRLRERTSQHAASLSGGEQQMLAIARGLLAKPQVLVLDEPSLGLAPVIVRQIIDLLGTLRDQGLTILLVEQNAHLALSVSDRAYVLEAGRVEMSGASADLRDDGDVRRAYLGLGVA
jgi:branched-chain amino acid transport system ATP-binding protein